MLVIGGREGIRYQRGFGHLTWKAQSPVPSPDSTLWDLASLTKVVGTLPAVACGWWMRGGSTWTRRSGAICRGSAAATKDRVTVRMLLDHSSGLPSYVQFFRLTRTRDSAIALLYRDPAASRAGER